MRQKWRCFPLITSVAAAMCGAFLVYASRAEGLASIRLAASPPVDLVIAPVLPILLAVLLSIPLLTDHGRAWGARVVSGFAWLSTATLLLLCAVGLVRSVCRPSIYEYLDQLRAATREIPQPGVKYSRERLGLSGMRLPERPMITEYREGPHGLRTSLVGDVTVIHLCASDGCRVGLAQSPGGLDGPDTGPSPESPEQWATILGGAPLQRWDQVLQLIRDPSGTILFLDAPDRPPAEFHLVDGRWKEVAFSAERIASKTSAPSAWLWTGVAGLAVAGLLLVLRRRVASRRRVLEAARAGTFGQDGRVTFDDGTVMRVDPPPTLAPGPVLVFRDLSSSTYRENDVLSQKDIRAGSLEDQLAKLRFDLLRCDAALAAVACLTAAPLLGATMAGLVI